MSRNADQIYTGLFDAAKNVQKNAHAPYSKFFVGAALLADDGKIYAACNVENAAYPQGVCAEAGAISAMVAAGAKSIEQICIVGDGEALVTPCGGCRQKLREFSRPDMAIHICDAKSVRRTFELQELLPFSFGPDNLENSK